MNHSLCAGTVAPHLKKAVATPLLKKSGLDSNDFKNFCPVLNLLLLSKILKRVVLAQLLNHLSQNNL